MESGRQDPEFPQTWGNVNFVAKRIRKAAEILEQMGQERPFSRACGRNIGCGRSKSRTAADELAELAEAAGAVWWAGFSSTGRRRIRRPGWSGQTDENFRLGTETVGQLLICDDDCPGSQIRNMEEISGLKVRDRTFSDPGHFAHVPLPEANSGGAGAVQYRLRRLVGLGQAQSPWAVASGPAAQANPTGNGLAGFIHAGSVFCGGRTRGSVAFGGAMTNGAHQRQAQDILTIAVVGYTNAGKSTLINALCHSNCYDGQVFATLDPSARRPESPISSR
jgi:GTP-binding protein HflX